MGKEAPQAEDRLVEMSQGLIGVITFVVEHEAGSGDMIGGLGAEPRKAGRRFVRFRIGGGFPFRRHGAPFPLTRSVRFRRSKPLVIRRLGLRLR